MSSKLIWKRIPTARKLTKPEFITHNKCTPNGGIPSSLDRGGSYQKEQHKVSKESSKDNKPAKVIPHHMRKNGS